MNDRDEKRPYRQALYGCFMPEGSAAIARRDLLKVSALALSGLALPHLAGCKGGSSQCSGTEAAALDCSAYRALPPNPPPGDTVVAMARRDDVARMTREAIDIAGGLGEIESGDTVLIKPNIVITSYSTAAPVVTNREVLAAVIDAVTERTAPANVYVGDACADLPTPTRTQDVAKWWGILDLCERKGVCFVSLKEYGFYPKSHPSWDCLAGWEVPISRFVVDRVQHLINVPVLKNHQAVTGSNCNYSCCIKNMFGVTDSAWRLSSDSPLGLNAFHNERLADNLAELHMILPPILMNVVDAVSVILRGGPVGAEGTLTTANPRLVLAGRDRVATDSVALAVLKYHARRECVTFSDAAMDYTRSSVWQNPQIVRAAHVGLGRINLVCDGLALEQVAVRDNGSIDNLGEILAEWT